MRFTEAEIELCKKIEGRWRKPLDWPDLVYYDNQIFMVYKDKTEKGIEIENQMFVERTDEKDLIPLLTLEDCLEFLRERNYEVMLSYFDKFMGYRIQVWEQEKSQAIYSDYDLEKEDEECSHKTPREAALKAVWEVLKGNPDD